jgi:hypothetical protein
MSYLDEFPPELVLLLSILLAPETLNALALTCRRLHEILQPELESRITPELAGRLLRWATANSKPYLVAKFLFPPHSTHPTPPGGGNWYISETVLHIAAQSGNTEIAALLLEVGGNQKAEYGQDDYQPFHLAVQRRDLEMMKLLLDYRAPIDAGFHGQTALHYACGIGHLGMIELLLQWGADVESWGSRGTPLGAAVKGRRFEVVKYLIDRGADATVTVPLFEGTLPPPGRANLLYVAMDLRHPTGSGLMQIIMKRKQKPLSAEWEGLPMSEAKKELMATLMVHGASKDAAMATISENLTALAKEVGCTEEEYLDIIARMFKEAQDAADLSRMSEHSLQIQTLILTHTESH